MAGQLLARRVLSGRPGRGFANGLSCGQRRPPVAAISEGFATFAARARRPRRKRCRGMAWLIAPTAHPRAGDGVKPGSVSGPELVALRFFAGHPTPRLRYRRPRRPETNRGNDPASRLRAYRGIQLCVERLRANRGGTRCRGTSHPPRHGCLVKKSGLTLPIDYRSSDPTLRPCDPALITDRDSTPSTLLLCAVPRFLRTTPSSPCRTRRKSGHPDR